MSTKYSTEEVAKHNKPDDVWIALHGKVYNVTKFLNEHPGGEDVLLALAGQDATQCFDEIGHSEEAIQLKDTYVIGELEGTFPSVDPPVVKKGNKAPGASGKEPTVDDDDWTYEEPEKESSPYVTVFIALAVLVYAVLFYYMYYSTVIEKFENAT